MGTADIIPGISGGTIALIVGIYKRLIKGIYKLSKNIKSAIYWTIKGDTKKVFNCIKDNDYSLFIPLFLGILSAIFLMSNIIHYLLANYPAYLYSFFVGLILSSSLIIVKEIEDICLENIFSFIFGFVLAIFISSYSLLSLDNSLLSIFISGALAVCAMILPGISGSYILVFLNKYDYLISAVKNLDFVVLFVFSLGGFVGLMSFSRIIYYLLKNFKSLTVSFLLGLMLGALKVPIDKILSENGDIFLCIILLIFGIITVSVLNYLSKYKLPKSYN